MPILTTKENASACKTKYPALRRLEIRAAFLFANFFLIIMALYHLKPARSSLFIEAFGASQLPYVWIGTALTMVTIIAWYHRLVERYNRFHVVLGSLATFAGALVIFRLLFIELTGAVAVSFYIFVDILGVVLVEQFWSLTNTIYSTEEGKRWYGLVGTGGLMGGVVGSGAGALLLKKTAMETTDLLLAAAVILVVIYILTWIMGYLGIYCEVDSADKPAASAGGWRALTRNRYLILITAILLLAQLASPVIEFQFMKTVESTYAELEGRTAFLQMFFSLLGFISIPINLVITPLVHRLFGVIAGLLVQPLAMSFFSWGYLLSPTILMGSATKISDRGLSYSINRASKELLYVPVDPLVIFQAKAWIDMFGYRLFKIFSSFVILLLTQWLPVKLGVGQLSWVTMGICAVWIRVVFALRSDYRLLPHQ